MSFLLVFVLVYMLRLDQSSSVCDLFEVILAHDRHFTEISWCSSVCMLYIRILRNVLVSVFALSVYLFNRLRTKHTQSEPLDDVSDRSDHEPSSPLDGTHIADSFTYPSDSSEHKISTRQLFAHGRAYLHNGWQFVSRYFHPTIENQNSIAQAAVSVERILSTFSSEDMLMYHSLASELAKEANISPSIRGILSPGHRRRLRGSSNSLERLFTSFLTALSSFTKDDYFLALLLRNEDFCRVLEQVARSFVDALPVDVVQPGQLEQNPADHSFTADRGPLSTIDCPPYIDWPTPDSSSLNFEAVDSHPEYPFHLRFLQILANISRHPQSQILLSCAAIQRLLSLWSASPSLHLTLFSQKVRENLQNHRLNLTETLSPMAVYYPDVFRLDRIRSLSNDPLPQLDIIFIHGMRGSVFHTWRQNDTVTVDGEHSDITFTKCWPRDWLSREFPNARILAIDPTLNPFVWDPICPVDKFQRTIDTRAKNILPQLRSAGVGQRPIIWITHSAGGILLKELLRMSCVSKDRQMTCASATTCRPDLAKDGISSIIRSSQPTIEVSEPVGTSAFDITNEGGSDIQYGALNFPTSTPECLISRSVDSQNGTSPVPVHESASLSQLPESASDLTKLTVGVVFMSVPHRGNQSLFGLYRRPLRWTLTPEAIQLERNSSFLLDLHAWFNRWAGNQKLPILTMVETRQTPVSRFWSVLLVPEDKMDREMGHVVHVDSDHMYISKPRDPHDQAYTHIVDFIHQIQTNFPASSSVRSTTVAPQ